MSMPSDHKALIFIAVVAVLGTGVRVVRAAGRDSAPAAQPALERQARAADSSAHAARGRGGGRGARGAGGARAKRGPSHAATDSAQRAMARDSAQRAHAGPLDRAGYVNGRLDLDVATAAQIDSLPGVSALMARRIAGDRVRRGPFLNREGLRRVVGVGPALLAQIDSLVTFSGTMRQAVPSDTIIARRITRPRAARPSDRGRAPPATPPAAIPSG